MHTKRDLSLPKLPERAIVASQLPRTRGMPVLGAKSSSHNLHEIPHRASPMEAAYISAFAALAGTAIGGLTSFATS